MITDVRLTLCIGEHKRFDAKNLNALIPKVRYLAIGGALLVRENPIFDFVGKLLIDDAHFRELTRLEINKDDRVTLKPKRKAAIKEGIIEKIGRLRNFTMNQIEFSYRCMLSIWFQ